MDIKNNILEAIGETPLVRLNKVVPDGAAKILVKCEFMNPAGSIKDRMAAHIIKKAEERGDLKPGGVIVENTSGNTGMGIAMAAAVKGYRCVFTMPDKMSQEKINMMRAFGAEVIITPTDVPGDSPEHYVNRAKAIAAETPGAFYVNQYHSPDNIEAHYLTSGPEILRQTDGKFDAFMGPTGTGGTVSGISKAIKEKAPHVRTIGVDILGSVHFHLFHTGTMPTPYVYKVEGIGEDIKCDAMDFTHVDDMVQVNDRDSLLMARRLVKEEGLFCGGSCGSVIHAAVEYAKTLGPDKTIVAILADSGSRYISKHLSDDWMRDNGMLEKGEDLGLVEDLLQDADRAVHTVAPTDPIQHVIARMRQYGVSQMPIVANGSRPETIVHEVDVLRALHSGKASYSSPVSEVANPIGGLVYPKARIEELFPILENDRVAVVVDANKLVGVVSQIDLVDFLAKRQPQHN
ncbi:MAG: pyridoxal-5'-phosphate-dependent protein subunit beta [Phycisphaerae bacterium]|nr:pyridoxal-5'-phosphate-dependent protein subunit beta [Phycisphaerae bacterium]